MHAFGSFFSMVADVTVDQGEVRVNRVVCAVDCGMVVNPNTVEAQIQGGVIFAITAALYSEITIERGRVQQNNFTDYRILRINETPDIEVHIVKSGEAPGGIGEPWHGGGQCPPLQTPFTRQPANGYGVCPWAAS